ncbi:MAG: CPBP family intramembrane metalloprotease, partial [bacterium]|nr:CPBP family intramembrane metalloprotease [bacterium]
MFKKPMTWLLLTALFCGSVIFIGRYFGLAFPIVNVTITMDRHAALAAGRDLCTRLNLPPDNGRQAAVFQLDDEVRNYVELEAGGAPAFQALLQEGRYMPYQWSVRCFRTHEVRESVVRFTPRGAPYGFTTKLPESAPGPALARAAAQTIAEKAAAADWDILTTNYTLVEASQENRPGGRIDHTFVYERPHAAVGEGRYRLRLVVAGDRLTELTHFIKIPEGFTRRYEQMRSANNVLGTAAQAVIYIAYFFGGCVIGLFFLLRQRRVLWGTALRWALLIAAINALMILNAFPLAWAGYATTDSYSMFRAQVVTACLMTFLQFVVLLGISFVAAEGLDRKAFGRHIQPWRLWSGGVANSATVLGQTVGGYYLAGIFLAVVVGLYVVTTRWLGWWNPSDALSDPNILGQYCPWLGAASALSPGFWEECLFRAVPLGCAALLGERLGCRKTVLGIACVLQAVVFGAAHASYPAQPAYARMVELTLTFTVFGLVYLRFGLLPVIIAHFVVDATAFSLPVFVSSAPGMWVNKAVCVALMAVPLAVPLVWWIVRRRLEPVPA